jgi:hypothetical protein
VGNQKILGVEFTEDEVRALLITNILAIRQAQVTVVRHVTTNIADGHNTKLILQHNFDICLIQQQLFDSSFQKILQYNNEVTEQQTFV